jgi:Lon protease-like protein
VSTSSDSALYAAVPIFPLPQVQLFPHALLPLHVFEPRYRELIKDALAGSQLIALPLLEPGYEARYDERPPVRPICGVGKIVAHEALPDGRSNVLLQGLTRVRILDELAPSRPYRLVRLQPLDDRLLAAFDAPSAQQTLLLLADQLALRLPSGGETLRTLARSQPDAGPLTDVLAAALVTDATDRQNLLETTDVATRVDLVTSHLGTLLAKFTNHNTPSN